MVLLGPCFVNSRQAPDAKQTPMGSCVDACWPACSLKASSLSLQLVCSWFAHTSLCCIPVCSGVFDMLYSLVWLRMTALWCLFDVEVGTCQYTAWLAAVCAVCFCVPSTSQMQSLSAVNICYLLGQLFLWPVSTPDRGSKGAGRQSQLVVFCCCLYMGCPAALLQGALSQWLLSPCVVRWVPATGTLLNEAASTAAVCGECAYRKVFTCCCICDGRAGLYNVIACAAYILRKRLCTVGW